jgi:hypothetical protein
MEATLPISSSQPADDASEIEQTSASRRASFRRPLWVWPFIAGAALAFGVTAFTVRPAVHVEYSAYPDPFADAAGSCETEQFSLATAVEAWYAKNGVMPGLTQNKLVSEGYLAHTVDSFQLTGGDATRVAIGAVPGGGCG